MIFESLIGDPVTGFKIVVGLYVDFCFESIVGLYVGALGFNLPPFGFGETVLMRGLYALVPRKVGTY